MKVVILKDVHRLGSVGDVTEVANGYARNYLIPKGLAVLATPQELARVDQLRRTATRRRAKEEEELQALAEKMEGVAVTVKARAGEGGVLYGSVTNADIAEELAKLVGYEIDRRTVELGEPIKGLGQFQVPVRIGPNRLSQVTVTVERQEAE